MGLKKFIKKLALFLFLPGLFFLGIFLVDPYNYFNVSKLIKQEVKSSTSAKIDAVLWKTVGFRRDPAGNIILGDSRAQNIDCALVEKLSGEKYYNLGCQGGGLAEFIDLFWYAEKIIALKKVYIIINFDSYSRYMSVNRMPHVKMILNNPLMYFIDRQVIKSAWFNLLKQFFVTGLEMFRPQMSKEEFWAYRLEHAKDMFTKYQYPSDYYLKLKEISNVCREHSIPLVFVIMPAHLELQEAIEKYNLKNAEGKFKDDLHKLGLVYDLNQRNYQAEDKNNFLDPYHPNPEFLVYLVKEIWGNNSGD